MVPGKERRWSLVERAAEAVAAFKEGNGEDEVEEKDTCVIA